MPGERVRVERFPVHILTLATYSPFFDRLFENKNANPQKAIEELTNDADLFKTLLYFIYTGKISEDAEKGLSNLEYCLGLYRLAESTEVTKLVEVCRHKLNKALNSVSLLPIATAAVERDDQQLLNVCRWYVRANPDYYNNLMSLEGLFMEELLIFANAAQSINAVSPPAKAAHPHEIDSAQELICQQIEKVETVEDFKGIMRVHNC